MHNEPSGVVVLAGPTQIEQLVLDTWGEDENVHIKVSDITKKMVADLPDVLIDLLEVAAYVYAADQAVPKGGKRSFDYGESWDRALHFRIAVRCPEVWSKQEVVETLASLLWFMSNDKCTFEFMKTQRAPPLPHYIEFSKEASVAGGIEEVLLFSGGLDSLAGAVKEAITDGRRIALVSHRPAAVPDSRQKALVAMLAEKVGEGPRPFHIPVWVNKDEPLSRDFNQRTRSFLYASLAVTTATMFGLPRFRFYENGPYSLNLPILPQESRARASRTTHPRVLKGFEKLFSQLLGKPFSVENPFRWSTRADILRDLKAAGRADLIRHTVSCGHTRQGTGTQPHCGVCSQCIDRRFAVLAANCAQHDIEDRYKVRIFTDPLVKPEDQATAVGYVTRATQVEEMKGQGALLSQFGESYRYLNYMDGRFDDNAQKMFDLCQRHACEIGRVVDAAHRAHATDIRKGLLPESSLLMILFGGRHATEEGVAGRELTEQKLLAGEPVSMRGFIEQYCRPLARGRAAQVATRILQEARRKPPKLKLPPTTNKATGNRKKLFRPADLRAKWPQYKRVIPWLPDLK